MAKGRGGESRALDGMLKPPTETDSGGGEPGAVGSSIVIDVV